MDKGKKKLLREILGDETPTELLVGEDGKDGRDGKDAEPVDEQKIIEKIIKEIPIPEDGKDGYTPVKGIDYFDGERGERGKDGESPDPEEIIEEVLSQIPKPKDGERGSPDTPEEIAGKLNTLTEAVDISVIKDAVTKEEVRVLASGMARIDGRVKLIDQRWGGHGSKPSGSDTDIQFNDGGVFGGAVGLTYNKTTLGTTSTGTIEVDVPTATEGGLIVKTTDNNTANPAIQLLKSDNTPLWTLRPDGRMFIPDGSFSLPSLSFLSEFTLGFYRIGSASMGLRGGLTAGNLTDSALTPAGMVVAGTGGLLGTGPSYDASGIHVGTTTYGNQLVSDSVGTVSISAPNGLVALNSNTTFGITANSNILSTDTITNNASFFGQVNMADSKLLNFGGFASLEGFTASSGGSMFLSVNNDTFTPGAKVNTTFTAADYSNGGGTWVPYMKFSADSGQSVGGMSDLFIFHDDFVTDGNIFITATDFGSRGNFLNITYDSANKRGIISASTSVADPLQILYNNFIYGSMYGDNVSISTGTLTAGVPVAVGSGLSAGTSNGFTFANSILTATVAGTYKVEWSMALMVASGANVHVEGSVRVNNTSQVQTKSVTHLVNSNDEQPVAGTGIITLAVNDAVKLEVENDDTTAAITVTHANLSLVRIDA